MLKKAFIFIIFFLFIGIKAYSMGFPHKLYASKVIKKVSLQLIKKVQK